MIIKGLATTKSPQTINPASAAIAPAPTVRAEDWNTAWRAYQAAAVHGRVWTGRYQLRYFRWGHGRPLIFIHGMADAPQAFVMVMHRLTAHFQCIAYQLPDGLMDGSDLSRYKLEDYVQDLQVLLDHLGLAAAVPVGSSFGSLIALAALARWPARLPAGILQNGFARRPFRWWEQSLARWGRLLPGWFADYPFIHRQVMRLLDQATLARLPPTVAATYIRHNAHTPFAAAARRALTIARTDLRPLLPAIRQPVLLLIGDCDRLVPRSCWQELAVGLSHLTTAELAGCGHYPQYTHPAEMAQRIEQFLLQHLDHNASIEQFLLQHLDHNN